MVVVLLFTVVGQLLVLKSKSIFYSLAVSIIFSTLNIAALFYKILKYETFFIPLLVLCLQTTIMVVLGVDFPFFKIFFFSPQALNNNLFISKDETYWLRQLASLT